MKVVKKISLILLIATITYGVVGLKSIAYCCGNCGQAKILHEEKEDCCHKNSKKQTSDCPKEDCCKVLELKFDWNISDHKFSSFPVYFLPALFFTSLPGKIFIEWFFPEKRFPPFNLHPREYLSFIRVLLI